ncbi:MAG: zinc-binding alcohol dehydrogenase [Candidatus Poribacteria bacterium]|nr:zinc-binding alcohol dehydrogenase [Candidatus Poribacteria bacterium]
MKGQRVIWPSRAKVEIEEFEIPPIKSDEVLIATECTLISPGTERAFLLGLPNAQGSYPLRPGYSNIGKVVEVGKDVNGYKVGDRIATTQGHTSHFVTKGNRLLKADSSEVSAEEVVFYNLGAIALQGVRKARIELGEPTLVIGQGLIGLLALQLAKLSGAVPIIAADLTDSRLELSKDIGADYTLNPEDKDFSERLSAASMGKGPVVVIEATGHPDAISTALAVAGWGARVVLLASTRGETPKVNFYRDVHKKGLIIYGAHNSIRPRQESSSNFWTSEDDSRLMLSLIAHKRFIVAPMISHRVLGHDAPKAYQMLMEWNPGLLGVVLQWNTDM